MENSRKHECPWQVEMRWRDAVAVKESELWADVPAEWRIEDLASKQDVLDVRALLHLFTSPVERRIADHNTVELLEALRQGDTTAQEVVRAFAHRALLAHQLVRASLSTPRNTMHRHFNPANVDQLSFRE